MRKETSCRHIGYSYRLTARVLLYAPSHRQDNTYHSLCYTSRALAGTRNSSMGPPHEGSIRRPIAPWANALPLSYVPLPVNKRFSYMSIRRFAPMPVHLMPVRPPLNPVAPLRVRPQSVRPPPNHWSVRPQLVVSSPPTICQFAPQIFTSYLSLRPQLLTSSPPTTYQFAPKYLPVRRQQLVRPNYLSLRPPPPPTLYQFAPNYLPVRPQLFTSPPPQLFTSSPANYLLLRPPPPTLYQFAPNYLPVHPPTIYQFAPGGCTCLF